MKKGNYVKIVKLTDDVFNGFHPNGIYEGYTVIGTVVNDIQIGERFNVLGNSFDEGLSTSPVTEIIDEHTFKTLNSTYRVESVNIDEYVKN